jgi:hypothetical protein
MSDHTYISICICKKNPVTTLVEATWAATKTRVSCTVLYRAYYNRFRTDRGCPVQFMMHETNAAIEPFYLKPAIRRTNSFSFILDVMCFTWLLVAGVRNGDKAWHDDSRCTRSSCTCSVADLCYCLQTPVPSRVRAALR